MQHVLMVVAILALLMAALVMGCGKKAAPGEGQPSPGVSAEGPAGGAPAGAYSGPPGAPGGGGPPGMMGGGGPPGMPGAGAPGTMGGQVPAGPGAATLVEEGMEAKKAGDYRKAENRFRDALAADLTSEDAHWGLAWVLAGTGQKDEAISEFGEVISLTIDAERRSESEQAIKRLQK